MKILQVIPYFAPAWDYGGPVSAGYNISKQLVERGHGVTVYTTAAFNATKEVRRHGVLDGIEVKRFRNLSNTLAYHYNIFLSPGIFFRIKKDLTDFDTIHIHEYRTFQNIVIHHYARKYGIPYILQAHGSLPRIMARQKLKQVYDTIWGYRLLKDAAKVIALTPVEAEQYKSMGVNQDRIEIVSNGIDLAEFDDLPERGEFKKKYGIPADHKIVLYLGRIHKIKGLDMLAQAYAKITKETDNIKLVITGPDDGYLPALRKLVKESNIEEKVLITGPLYDKDKLEAYVDADVYVLPSSYEIFGITILEACACGTPVIVTDRCGIADVIDGQAGLVVPYDRDALSEAILDILSDNSKRQGFSENGKLLVREQYDWEIIVNRIEDMYLQCGHQ